MSLPNLSAEKPGKSRRPFLGLFEAAYLKHYRYFRDPLNIFLGRFTIWSGLVTESRAKLIASAAICAALYAIVNSFTAPLRTPWGVGEFRPGVVIPGFFAVAVGPIPAAVGAAVGSFVADMITLVPSGASTPLLALAVGAPANLVGFLLLGWVFQKISTWKGFIIGTTSGLFVGNLVAATGVVALLGLPPALILGLLFFWFGTMFPFVVIFVPALVRLLRPLGSQLSVKSNYPEIVEPNPKVLWTWSIMVAVLVLAAMVVILLSESAFVQSAGGPFWWGVLFIASAISVIGVGAFIPSVPPHRNVKLKSS